MLALPLWQWKFTISFTIPPAKLLLARHFFPPTSHQWTWHLIHLNCKTDSLHPLALVNYSCCVHEQELFFFTWWKSQALETTWKSPSSLISGCPREQQALSVKRLWPRQTHCSLIHDWQCNKDLPYQLPACPVTHRYMSIFMVTVQVYFSYKF